MPRGHFVCILFYLFDYPLWPFLTIRLIRYAVMCPMGSEGTSYALLTTVSNVAYAVAYAIGDLLTGE